MGIKSTNLIKLKEAKFAVPVFISVSTGLSIEQFNLEITNSCLSNYKLFAVRSSSDIEDNESESKAGYFYSAVAVKKESLFQEYEKVVESIGIGKGKVIIQRFIVGERSGVLFSDNGNNQIIINSNFGLCKTVVEGEICDEFIVSKNANIIEKFIPKQKEFLKYTEKGLSYSSSSLSSLNALQIKKLTKAAKRIEALFGQKQDIEWTFYRKKLYILQARPITRNLPEIKQKIYFDSANIAESYSGIILPLTLSFATKIYKVVYENLIHYSGVSRKKIKKHPEVFNNMLGWFYGRLYYNMNNWYKMTSFIPGYKRNKENLENMISSNIRKEINTDILPNIWLKTTYPIILIAKLTFFKRQQKRFQNRVKNYIIEFRKEQLSDKSYESCKQKYFNIENELLSKWHIPVENDFMVMTFFGILNKKLNENQLNTHLQFESKTGVQIKELLKLKNELFKIDEIKNSIINYDADLFKEQLSSYPKLQILFDKYFIEFGGRFANELKLESTDIEDDIGKLFKLFNLYNNYSTTEKDYAVAKNDLGLFANYTIRKFKKHASKREELRLLRSNCFSLIRKIFNQIGKIYTEENRMQIADDIFYLTVEEVFEHLDDYKTKIEIRKKEYEEFKTVNPPVYFSAYPDEKPDVENPEKIITGKLQGRACSAGTIKGKVKVFKEYSFPENIDFDIIVAKHTDPGWTTLLGLCKGLIVEHGGILSHAAIVSRELGIPTVIGLENATQVLKDKQWIELNGDTGEIRILDEN